MDAPQLIALERPFLLRDCLTQKETIDPLLEVAESRTQFCCHTGGLEDRMSVYNARTSHRTVDATCCVAAYLHA